MAMSTTLSGEGSRRFLGVFFALSSLLPLMIMIYVILEIVAPALKPTELAALGGTFVYCIGGMFLISLLGFLLLLRSIKSLGSLVKLFEMKTTRAMGTETPDIGGSLSTIVQAATGYKSKSRLSVDSMSTFIDVATTLTSELDYDRLFPLIISKITEAMSAERTSLYEIDWDTNELTTRVAEQIGQLRIPIGESISGHVAETGEMLNVADAWDLPFHNRDSDTKYRFRTKSVLCTPIKNRFGEMIGVLQVINAKKKDRFDAEDENFLRDLTAQVGIALENARLIEESFRSFDSSIRTLSATVDARHPYTAGHSDRVTEYALLIAREMELDEKEIEVLRLAGLLHDIGKIGVKDEILLKNGRFNDEERAEMNKHPEKTKTILDKFRFPRTLKRVPDIALHHHERMDGRGYPSGLRGGQLPLGSRILAVADVFDAITSRRDYPKYVGGEILSNDPMPLPKAVSILQDGAGTQFDPKIVDAFLCRLPQALLLYRGGHFPEEYVDDMICSLDSSLLQEPRAAAEG